MQTLTAKLLFVSLNTRREKAGEGLGPIAVDLALKGQVKLQDVGALFGSERTAHVIDALYDAEGNLLSTDVAALKLNSDLENYRVTLKAGKQRVRFETADLNKISLAPGLSRTLDLSGRVQAHPTDEQYAQLTAFLGCEVTLTVDQVQGSLFTSGGDEDADEDGEKESAGKGGKATGARLDS